MLRDCTDSENVDKLSAHAEVLFYRLMMKADDYGSFYGNVKLIKSNCYPLRIDTVRDADISRWMDELLKAGLIVVYKNAGKTFLRIHNFGQRLRNKKKRFPDCPPEFLNEIDPPPPAANGGHPPPEVELEVEVEEEVEHAHEETFLNDKAFSVPLLMNWRLSDHEIKKMISDFEIMLLAEGKSHPNYIEWRKHFHNWGAKRFTEYATEAGGMVC
jgi:hypothetical protein